MITKPEMEFIFEDLYAATLKSYQPFCLRLNNNEMIECNKLLRLVPQKRMVAAGLWQGREIVAKLFFDPKRLHHHIETEVANIHALQQNKIPTPEILLRSATSDGRVQILIFERILESRTLQEIWQNEQSRNNAVLDDELLSLLKTVTIEIATQHVLGLVQEDLHFNNFLLTDRMVYTLDGASFKQTPFLLPRQASMNNLALFLSQFGAGVENLQETLFLHYAKARGWTIKLEDKLQIFFLVKQWNQARWHKFEKKIWRNATQFVSHKHFNAFGMMNRQYAGPALENFLDHPEEVFDQAESLLIKDGNSATVKKIMLDDRYYIIKRYNILSAIHALRRCLRPTRAFMCWRVAHKLNLFYIPTAMPVAFIEKRFFFLRGKSFLVTEYISNENVAQYLVKYEGDDNKISDMIKRSTALIKSLFSIEITHGDLKISNILVDKDNHPVLIDLDGATEHVSFAGLRKKFKKEWQRFLRNFESDPVLQQKFEKEYQG